MSKISLPFRKKKNDTPERVVELVLDDSTYKELKARANAESISENEEILRSLKRGMNDYWLHVAKHEKERYDLVEELYKQSKQDNELLEAIVNQNDRLHRILEGGVKGIDGEQ